MTQAAIQTSSGKKKLPIMAKEKILASQSQKDLSKRDALIERYLSYATSIANKIAQTLSSDVDVEEVVCNARLGLLEAAKRFDPKMGVDFKTFAYYRIRGAIFDGLRKTGWIPRSLYAKIKFEQAANDYLQTKSEEAAVSKNPSAPAEQEAGELYDTVNSLASIYIISLDASEEPMEIEDKKANNIEHKAEFQKIKEVMRQSIEDLPDKERKLIKMYYFQNKTLEEAGSKLKLSKSWTSRLHARALELLFKKISTMQLKATGKMRVQPAV